jgi:hypothetical protein
MAKAIHNIILQAIKIIVPKLQLILVGCDEVMILNNQSWLSVHVYVVE